MKYSFNGTIYKSRWPLADNEKVIIECDAQLVLKMGGNGRGEKENGP